MIILAYLVWCGKFTTYIFDELTDGEVRGSQKFSFETRSLFYPLTFLIFYIYEEILVKLYSYQSEFVFGWILRNVLYLTFYSHGHFFFAVRIFSPWITYIIYIQYNILWRLGQQQTPFFHPCKRHSNFWHNRQKETGPWSWDKSHKFGSCTCYNGFENG